MQLIGRPDSQSDLTTSQEKPRGLHKVHIVGSYHFQGPQANHHPQTFLAKVCLKELGGILLAYLPFL
jgi:hypothetical protein